jgi:fumarate reductase subunit D
MILVQRISTPAFIAALASLLFPLPLLAQGPQTFRDIANIIVGLVSSVIPLIVALALLAFFYGLFRYLWHAGDQKAYEQGRSIMLWGVIALFVMICVYGIVQLIQATLFGA